MRCPMSGSMWKGSVSKEGKWANFGDGCRVLLSVAIEVLHNGYCFARDETQRGRTDETDDWRINKCYYYLYRSMDASSAMHVFV